MHTENPQPNRVRRAVNDLVLAEMFLVQATIESAAAITDGINDLGRQWNQETDGAESFSSVIQRTADNVIEPYSTRFAYLRELIEKDVNS